MRKHRNPLAAYFYSELRRLADGEKSGPVTVVDKPAAPPAEQGKVTLWGEIKYAKPVPMSVPPCLFTGEAGQARRFAHARDILIKVLR